MHRMVFVNIFYLHHPTILFVKVVERRTNTQRIIFFEFTALFMKINSAKILHAHFISNTHFVLNIVSQLQSLY